MRVKFREEKMAAMTEEMGEKLMENEEERGGNGLLGKKGRVRLLTMAGVAWSQMENETLKWYERFSVYYLPLEIGNRSVAKAYALYSGKPQPAAPPDWYRMRKKWDWEGRAAAYDIARTDQRKEMLDDVGLAIEDEIKGALLIGLRAAVERIERIGEKGITDMDTKTAMAAIPRLAKELQDVYGVGKKAGATKSIEGFLAALPKALAQGVMLYIERSQQAQLPANTRGDIVEGKVVKLEPARLVKKRENKLI